MSATICLINIIRAMANIIALIIITIIIVFRASALHFHFGRNVRELRGLSGAAWPCLAHGRDIIKNVSCRNGKWENGKSGHSNNNSSAKYNKQVANKLQKGRAERERNKVEQKKNCRMRFTKLCKKLLLTSRITGAKWRRWHGMMGGEGGAVAKQATQMGHKDQTQRPNLFGGSYFDCISFWLWPENEWNEKRRQEAEKKRRREERNETKRNGCRDNCKGAT